MNLCILIGKIVSEIEFKFIINSKQKSIAQFDLELSNKSIVKIKAYDEIADYSYRKLIKEDIICVDGYIDNVGEIVVSTFFIHIENYVN